MNRMFRLICGLLIGVSLAQGATAKSIIWGRQVGVPNAEDRGDVGVAVDTAGNVYICGTTKGTIKGMTPNQGEADGFVAKYDAKGKQLWIMSFDGEEINSPGNDVVSHIEIDSNGDLIVLGGTSGAMKGNKAAAGSEFMAKLDADGNVIWARHLINSKHLHSHCFWTSFRLDADDNIYLAGANHGMGLHGNKAYGFHDVFLMKLTPDASKRLWTKQFGSSKRDDCLNHTVAPDGSVYIVGSSYDVIEPGATSQGTHDAFVANVSAQGELAFIKQFGTREVDEATAVAVHKNGKVYVAGYGHPKGKGMFLSVYSPEGEELSTLTYGTKLPRGVVQMTFDAKGRLWLAGKEDQDAFVIRMSDRGKPGWLERFPVKAGAHHVSFKVGPKGMLHMGGVSQHDRRKMETADLFLMKIRPK